MKVGLRTPSIKKSIRARTTGKYKRKLKRLTNPFYGKKGIGWIKNPSRALKNKIYHKTTFSVKDMSKGIAGFFVAIFSLIWTMIKWFFFITWIIIKYSFLALVWLFVLIYNGIVALVEKIVNIGRNEEEPNNTNGSGLNENALADGDIEQEHK